MYDTPPPERARRLDGYGYAYGYGQEPEPGPGFTGRDRGRVVEGRLVQDGYGNPGSGIPGPRSGLDPGALDAEWDPSDELASLLDDALARSTADFDQPPAPMPMPTPMSMPMPDEWDAPVAPERRVEDTTAELPPLRRARADHRRRRVRERTWTWVRTVSFCIAAVVAALVAMVSVFSGVVAYDPLRGVAADRTGMGVAGWWPVLVYGPWAVASLSILRAALHRRRALHSWLVVLLFSTTGMLLGVAHEAHTIIDAAVAALPAAASLACFQQLVRLVTLTRPPKQANPRHRVLTPRRPSAAPPPARGRPETSARR
ncbi:DUF2637 domain-containing protein [Streptomyces lichenis]|uniref:DUF2637 domain-containing protein n=1 Tax=Streptomyces lichenis TaxID=2306967 RepID=A0ABT0IGM4_9ACTN|nr:DUF2637 domain-containing protein [Streptomyces lichenis]MCK8680483.1 DUF2637 domain-containing protein [Streptomyces lichenis]